MKRQFFKSSLWFLSTLVSLSFTSLATATTTGAIIALPMCGPKPVDNTKILQAKIDLANPGDTLVLPAGVCVVARCDLAQGHICYGVDGRPHRSALHSGNKSYPSGKRSTEDKCFLGS
jgi:hypothetical protein